MVGYTDLPYRALVREFTKKAWLFTEMIVVNRLRHAPFHAWDKEPDSRTALQVAGNSPDDLAWAASEAEARGYPEINLNVGCPSKRIVAGNMGACMMLEPQHLLDCLSAMRQATSEKLVISAKIRLGVGSAMPADKLTEFLQGMQQAGVQIVYVHARAALLNGVSTAQNRSIPPLRHDLIAEVAQEISGLELVCNGGLDVLPPAKEQASLGVMVGRNAYNKLLDLLRIDSTYYGDADPCASGIDELCSAISRASVRVEHEEYAVPRLTRHLTQLVRGAFGAREKRRLLVEANSIDCATALLRDAGF